jgi:hypothetical protein
MISKFITPTHHRSLSCAYFGPAKLLHWNSSHNPKHLPLYQDH